MASGGAAQLNSRRSGRNPARVRASLAEMARLSSATATVPAAGPNTTAAVRVNTSEMEKLAGIAGTLSTAVPASSVSAASTHHSIGRGAALTSISAPLNTAQPASTTAPT